jgi:hypothetical protein
MKSEMEMRVLLKRLANGVWIVGILDGPDQYGRNVVVDSGFEKYENAERHALESLKKALRKFRDAPEHEKRLRTALGKLE